MVKFMNISVIESSPHKKGSSNLLAEHFIQGAEEARHKVTVFDAARANLHPCMGCDACGMSGPCCQKDDMAYLPIRFWPELVKNMERLQHRLLYAGMCREVSWSFQNLPIKNAWKRT